MTVVPSLFELEAKKGPTKTLEEFSKDVLELGKMLNDNFSKSHRKP